jgi:hypothetical protein
MNHITKKYSPVAYSAGDLNYHKEKTVYELLGSNNTNGRRIKNSG